VQLREAARLSDLLIGQHPLTTAFVISNIHIHNRLGSLDRMVGNYDGAEASLRKAFDGQERLAARFEGVYIHTQWLARMALNLADVFGYEGKKGLSPTGVKTSPRA